MYPKPRQGDVVNQFTGSGALSFRVADNFLALTIILITMFGSLTATYASGTPAARQGSVMNSVISNIRFVVAGDTIKSASPEMFRIEALLAQGFAPTLRATAGASATDYPTTEIAGGASVTYGTTGQFQNFFEVLPIFNILHWCDNLSEKYSTAVRTKGLSESWIYLDQQDPLNIRDGANTAPVVYSNLSLLKFKVDYEELKEDVAGELDNEEFINSLEYYREIQQTAPIAGQNDNNKVNLNGRNGKNSRIVHHIMKLRAGEAGTSTTATSKQPNDAIITKIDVWGNDVDRLVDSTWLSLKFFMKSLKPYFAPLTNGVGEDTGVSGIFFIRKRKGEAKPVSQYTTYDLIFKSEAQGTGTDYGTAGAQLKILTGYITSRV